MVEELENSLKRISGSDPAGGSSEGGNSAAEDAGGSYLVTMTGMRAYESLDGGRSGHAVVRVPPAGSVYGAVDSEDRYTPPALRLKLGQYEKAPWQGGAGSHERTMEDEVTAPDYLTEHSFEASGRLLELATSGREPSARRLEYLFPLKLAQDPSAMTRFRPKPATVSELVRAGHGQFGTERISAPGIRPSSVMVDLPGRMVVALQAGSFHAVKQLDPYGITRDGVTVFKTNRTVGDELVAKGPAGPIGVSVTADWVHPAVSKVLAPGEADWLVHPWQQLRVESERALRLRKAIPFGAVEDPGLTQAWQRVWNGVAPLETPAIGESLGREILLGLASDPLPLVLTGTAATRDVAFSVIQLLQSRPGGGFPGAEILRHAADWLPRLPDLQRASPRPPALPEALALGALAMATAVLARLPRGKEKNLLFETAVEGISRLALRISNPIVSQGWRLSCVYLLLEALAMGVANSREDRFSRDFVRLVERPALQRLLDQPSSEEGADLRTYLECFFSIGWRDK